MLEICTHASANVHMSTGTGKPNKHAGEALKGGDGATEHVEMEEGEQKRRSVNHPESSEKLYLLEFEKL